jgi:hypothetical protein
MAKDDSNNEVDFDALLESAVRKFNKEIYDNTPSNKATWQAVKKNFIEEGIWEESIFSKIFYWPTKTIDRIIVALKSFFMLFLGIGIVLLQPQLLTMKGESEVNNQIQITSENIQFEYEVVKKQANPIEFMQSIVSAAITAEITVTVSQDSNGDTVLILYNLSPMSDQLILKSLIGLSNQTKGNVRVVIQDNANY